MQHDVVQADWLQIASSWVTRVEAMIAGSRPRGGHELHA
jgi:hypothetical protein